MKVRARSLDFGVGSICEMVRSRCSIVAFASRERNFIFEAVCSYATTDACSKNDRTRSIGKSDKNYLMLRRQTCLHPNGSLPDMLHPLKTTLANPGKHSLNPKNARYPSESGAGHVMWVIVWRFAETEWIGKGAPD